MLEAQQAMALQLRIPPRQAKESEKGNRHVPAKKAGRLEAGGTTEGREGGTMRLRLRREQRPLHSMQRKRRTTQTIRQQQRPVQHARYPSLCV